MNFTPYLNFNGTCRAAFEFYEQVLDGHIEFLQTHGDSPMKEHVPADWQDKVIHVCLKVGEQRIMGSDAPAEHFAPAQGMCINITVPSVSDGQRLFDAFAEGGRVAMPFAQTFWTPGFGMVTDKFGTPWMINCENR
jgi:PhnB protein